MPKETKKRTVIYSNVKANKKRAEEKNKMQNDQINLNDEVIIGFNTKKNGKGNGSDVKPKKKEENKIKKEPKVQKKTVKKAVQNDVDLDEKIVTPKKNNNTKVKTKPKQKVKVKFKIPLIFKIFTVIIIFAVALVALLKSPMFNIKEIVVMIDHDVTLTESEIKELSNIVVGQNMYSIDKKASIENIKTNSYVESVNIKRKIPNKLVIEVVERSTTFQLENENGYVYVDSQGVVIDQKSEKKDCINIVGYKTEEIVIGNKLNEDDIKGLSDVQVIIQEAKNNELYDEITKIDISNHDDYLVYFDNQNKLAHIGDISSINDKMTRVAKILKVESEVSGEIFVNVDFNNGKYPYFRENI